jgi:hypothetical protein
MLIERKDLFTGETYYVDQDDIPGRFGISFNRLKELVECDPVEGWAKWKVDRGRNKIVEVGDHLPGNTTCVDQCWLHTYHIIWVFHTKGIWAKSEIDHKDGNHYNNRISNLREATHSQNHMNHKLQRNNTSGVTGVKQRGGKWQATIKVNGKDINLGYFYDFDDAVAARHDAEDKYFGEFAARHSRPQIKYTSPDLFAQPEDICDAALIWATTDCTRYGATHKKGVY